MKKKLLFLLPVAALMLAGCSSSNPDTPTTSGDPTTSLTPTTVTPYTPTHAGTEADPLDATDAYGIASRLAESGSQEKFPTEASYYVKGVVTSAEDWNAQYKNMTFKIGEPDSPFTGYRLKVGEAKEDVPDADYLKVGDTVTFYGQLLNFHGTMETHEGAYIVSVAKAVTGVTLDFENKGVVKGSTTKLNATVAPETAANKNVTWSVKDASPEGCVTVDQDGTVHGVEVGTAKVVVTTVDGAKTAECAITVTASAVHVTSITLSEETVDMYVGDTKTLTATVLPVDATDPSFTWDLQDVTPAGSIALANGVLTSTAAGTAKVVVTTTDGGLTDECTVTSTIEHGTVVTDPLNFAEAYAIADALPKGETSTAGKQYFIRANVLVDSGDHKSEISYNKNNFFMSGTVNEETKVVKVYGMCDVNNKATFTNDSKIVAGDGEITIAAGIENYYKDGNNTLEFTRVAGEAECYLVTEKTPTAISLDENEFTIKPTGEAVVNATVLPLSRVKGDVTFTIKSGEEIGQINAQGNKVTITTKDGTSEGTVTVGVTFGTVAEQTITVEFDNEALAQWKYTFEAQQWTAAGEKTIGGKAWTQAGTLSSGTGHWGYDGTKGQQFGKAASYYTELTLTTSDFDKPIKAVKVSTSGASSTNAKVSIEVDGSAFGGEAKEISATNTEYVFNGSATGDLVIKWTQTSAKAIYVKQIIVLYDDTAA